jgi:hypothetical protein
LENGFGAAAPQVGYSSNTIHVKFKQGTPTSSPESLLPTELRRSVVSINRLFNSLPKSKLDELKQSGENRSGAALPDMNLWFSIRLRTGVDSKDFLERLKRLPSVESAQPAPLPAPPSAATPDFGAKQGYIGLGPTGVDASFSWTVPGGNGSGVTIYDVEYSWNQNHEDLRKAQGIPLLMSPGDLAIDPFDDNNHGTAVLGLLIADRDNKGVTGISWGAAVKLVPANTAILGYNPANAILLAAADGEPGDVILIEQQAPVCGLSFGPSEWSLAVFDAIRIAVAIGIVVVEAAGNGEVDLDHPACGGLFDRRIRDSGAIVVGAGSPPFFIDRHRLSFSSFGSRVDVQGWGSGVMTTGIGSSHVNQHDPANPNFWYGDGFGGTSSASAMVAGVVANLQGLAKTLLGTPFSPIQLRMLLSQTGSPQLGNTGQNIGPRPNLRFAIAKLTSAINSLVSFVPVSSSHQTTPNAAGCPPGYIGKFSFSARLANSSSVPSLAALMTRVTVLSNGNLLLNADGGPSPAGAVMTIHNNGHFADGILSPGENTIVPFTICLKELRPFSFFVDVIGIGSQHLSNSLVMR